MLIKNRVLIFLTSCKMNYSVQTVKTTFYEGQRPGTSGLRKKVKIFQQENYTENFVQAVLTSLGDSLEGSALVVGGDGRYYGAEAISKIIKLAAGNKVGKLIIGQNGLLSTPAASCIIRKYSLVAGLVLTASHNPGGLHADFGIKLNLSNGGAAPDAFTNKIYEISKCLTEYYTVPELKVDITKLGKQTFTIGERKFEVEVIDSVDDYLELMKSIFDFDKLRLLIQGCSGISPFKILLNCMHGVTGPYVNRIFVEELGADPSSMIKTKPLQDFGGLHPDPNLTYAADLVNILKSGEHDFASAFDGDGDRIMILGKEAFFVNPSDSLAVLSDHLMVIPYFQKTGIRGYGRSMPTGSAIDKVAKAKNAAIYEVPTGWKYFANLLDANKISICGEESFGTGSDHIREKDGIWTALAWLSIIQHFNLPVQTILENHWKKYGKNYYTRYDYEQCNSDNCFAMMRELEANITRPEFVGTVFSENGKCYITKTADNFIYTDPIDGTCISDQGLRILFEDGSRIIFRLSGTGSTGTTVRLYIECPEENHDNIHTDTQEALQPLIKIALDLSKLEMYTGRDNPTVIT